MVNQFLKMAGVKTQAEFYKKYPSEEAFFRAHPEAQNLVQQKMAYGGINAYAPGGPIQKGTMSKAIADYQQSQAQPSAGSDGMTDFIRRPQDSIPAIPVSTPVAAQQHFALNPYEGASVWDMLNAQGKAGDYKSRKELAKTLGMSNYSGKADQNAQMMEMIRKNPDALLNYTAQSGTSSGGKKAGSKKQKMTDADLAAFTQSQADQNPFIMAPGAPGAATPVNYFPSAGRGPVKKYNTASEEYIANDPYFFADEGDNAFVKAVDAPFTWGRNQAAKLVMDNDLMAGAKVVGAGAGVGLLGRAYDYFKPRYEPYNPNTPKQLPGSGPIAGQRALPSSQMKQLPGASPRGWTMGENAVRSPGYPMHLKGGQPCYNCGGMYASGGENDYSGTYSNGVYYQAGGSYNPTTVDYGPGLPQFGMGKAMYGAGMRDGGQNDVQALYDAGYNLEYLAQGGPTFSDVTLYPHQAYVPAYDWMAYGGPAYSNVTQYNHQQYVPALDWMQNGGMNSGMMMRDNQYAQGGLVKGSVHDVSEEDVQHLINQGYKIQYL